MTDIPVELMYGVMKQVQSGQTEIKSTLADHTRQFLRIREDINNLRDDINNLRSDDLRRETTRPHRRSRMLTALPSENDFRAVRPAQCRQYTP